jgi:hypothetical protein
MGILKRKDDILQGTKQLGVEEESWQRLKEAIACVLSFATDRA